jgi:hypothetical protein
MTTHEVVIDMVESFSPGFHALLCEINELGAEATPETALTIATNATGFDLILQDLRIRNIMGFLQMLLKALSTVPYLGAGTAFDLLRIAEPRLEMEVLRVFVSFPIILAAESFVASREGAAIRPRVTLHVFSELG